MNAKFRSESPRIEIGYFHAAPVKYTKAIILRWGVDIKKSDNIRETKHSKEPSERANADQICNHKPKGASLQQFIALNRVIVQSVLEQNLEQNCARTKKGDVKDQNRYSPFLTLSLFLSRKTSTVTQVFSL